MINTSKPFVKRMYIIHVYCLKKCILSKSMEHSCSPDAKIPSTRQGIPPILCHKEMHYLVRTVRPLVPITPQTNAVHNVTSNSLQRQFNKILQTKWSHSFKFFPPKLSISLASLSRVNDMPRHCHTYDMF